MPATCATYKFSQRFSVSAKKAYEWCTRYEPNDLLLMNEKGQRKIQKITDDTVILRETTNYKRKKIRKTKLVKLNPSSLSWYNIQISGPNRYSAFLYEIVPVDSGRSKLNFTGLLVVYSNAKLSSQRINQVAYSERRYDSNVWRLLAGAMARDAKHES